MYPGLIKNFATVARYQALEKALSRHLASLASPDL